jgi:ribosomal protein L11
MDQIERVAKKKMSDMNAMDLEACKRMVAGSAVSMGLSVAKH